LICGDFQGFFGFFGVELNFHIRQMEKVIRKVEKVEKQSQLGKV